MVVGAEDDDEVDVAGARQAAQDLVAQAGGGVDGGVGRRGARCPAAAGAAASTPSAALASGEPGRRVR